MVELRRAFGYVACMKWQFTSAMVFVLACAEPTPATQAPQHPPKAELELVAEQPPAPAPAPVQEPVPPGTNTEDAEPALLSKGAASSLTVSHVLVAGPVAEQTIRTRLEEARSTLAACTNGENAVAVEITFALTPEGAIPRVSVYGEVAAGLADCIGHALGAVNEVRRVRGEPSHAYALLTFNTPSSSPLPPTLKKDLQLQCDAFKLSGAMEQQGVERIRTARDWIAENVRHPGAHHLQWALATANPAEKMMVLGETLSAAGLTRCHASGWKK